MNFVQSAQEDVFACDLAAFNNDSGNFGQWEMDIVREIASITPGNASSRNLCERSPKRSVEPASLPGWLNFVPSDLGGRGVRSDKN